MNNFWQELHKPYFVMAPMAGYTDQPFRIMCKHYGADVVVSEMVSSEALYHNAISKSVVPKSKQILKTLKLIEFSKVERPYVVQIFGSDPEKMALSAEYIASGKWHSDLVQISNIKTQNDKSKSEIGIIPDGIDINMGCPARDVVKTGAGVSLMKDVSNAQEIVYEVRKKVRNMPISVKTRLGWTKPDEIMEFSKYMQAAGAQALIVHGRTFKGGFSAPVDWGLIGSVKKQLSIPVIGNGGIDGDFKLQITNVESDSDGYMVGRGALGKPWIFKKLKDHNMKRKIDESVYDNYIDKKELTKIILKHAELVDRYKGEWGIREFRKHFVWYLSGVKGCKKFKRSAVRVETLEDIRKICENMVN